MQGRRAPFDREATRIQKGARRSEGGIDRLAGGKVAIEMPGQRHCGLVRNRELHGDHRRDATADETLRHAAEGIASRRRGAHAAIEEDQPQRGQMIAQQHRELPPGNGIGRAGDGVRFEHQHTFVTDEIAMTDEMQYVGARLQQGAVEAFQRGVVKSYGLDPAA